MGYHVALELTPGQVKQLKILATQEDTSVKDLVSELVKKEISSKSESNKREEKI